MIGLNYVNDKKSLGEWFNWIFHAHLVQTSIFTEAFHQWAVENYQINGLLLCILIGNWTIQIRKYYKQL